MSPTCLATGLLLALAMAACASPEQKLVEHIEELEQILDEHQDQPKEGLVELRQYLRKNLPQILELLGELAVELDELEDTEAREQRIEALRKTLEEPLRQIAQTTEQYGLAVFKDEAAMQYVERIAEQWQGLDLLLDGAAGRPERKVQVLDEAASTQRRLEQQLAEVQLAIDEQRFDPRPKPCLELEQNDHGSLADKDTEHQIEPTKTIEKTRHSLYKKCLDFDTQRVAALSGELRSIRDQGAQNPELWSKCTQLETEAEALGQEALASAQQLCAETKAATELSLTLALVEQGIEQRRGDFPWECRSAIDTLQKLDSDWSRSQVETLSRRCYLDLGTSVLAKQVPEMKGFCSYDVEQILKGAAQWQLSSPDFDSLRSAAKPLCDP